MIKRILLISCLVAFAVIIYADTNPKWSVPIAMNPPAPSVGNTVRFTATLWVKQGGIDNLRVIGGVDGSTIFTKNYSHCDRQYLEELSFTWVATAGSHRAWFQIDPDETTPDIDRSDNRTEMRFTVSSGGDDGGTTPTGTGSLTALTIFTRVFTALDPCAAAETQQADLTVSEFTLTRDSHRDDKAFYKIKIKNNGRKCLRLFRYKLMDDKGWSTDGTSAAVRPLWTIKGGEEKTFYGFILKGNLHGVHELHKLGRVCEEYSRFKVIVDYDNQVPESNEDNNDTGWKNHTWWTL